MSSFSLAKQRIRNTAVLQSSHALKVIISVRRFIINFPVRFFVVSITSSTRFRFGRSLHAAIISEHAVVPKQPY